VTAIDPRGRWIVHFTHVDNLPGIVAEGRLVCDGVACRGLTRTEVGDVRIKEARRRRAVGVDPGGCVGDYVPFYFGPRSPMMYRIAADCRDSISGRYPDGDRPLVYFATTVGAVVDDGLGWVATDGNAATATSRFTSVLDELDGMVDWPLMTAPMWNNTPEDPDRQRRRMAEFLVHRELPLPLVRRVVAYSDSYADRARLALAGHDLSNRVFVRPDWYYGYERR
jgi:ssDNA thymidine ADP-ribosyltransferase, DarT